MFGSDKKKVFSEKRKDTERSLISETVSIDGTVNSSGSIDIAGLIKGPVNSHEVVIKDTGSISGQVEAERVEIYGHLDGKVSAENVVIGSTGVVKGDIEFSQNLRTEDGADIEGYIKKSSNAGKKESKSAGDFLFSKSPEEKKYSVPVHEGKPEVLVKSKKNSKTIEEETIEGDGRICAKTIKRGDCIELGQDKFDETLNEFLAKLKREQIISVHPVNYAHYDPATQKYLDDYGAMVIYER